MFCAPFGFCSSIYLCVFPSINLSERQGHYGLHSQDVLHLCLFHALGLRWARKLFLMQPQESAAKILKTDSLPYFKGHLKE
jgi:hypothetical protein